MLAASEGFLSLARHALLMPTVDRWDGPSGDGQRPWTQTCNLAQSPHALPLPDCAGAPDTCAGMSTCRLHQVEIMSCLLMTLLRHIITSGDRISLIMHTVCEPSAT